MFVDFRDLNRASSKDDLPLPHIDILVATLLDMTFSPSWMGMLAITKLKW